jgi:hypothetical protein
MDDHTKDFKKIPHILITGMMNGLFLGPEGIIIFQG